MYIIVDWLVDCLKKTKWLWAIQGVPIKNNPLEKKLYFSHGLSQTDTFYVSIHTTYPANVIEITDMVFQIQQFKL